MKFRSPPKAILDDDWASPLVKRMRTFEYSLHSSPQAKNVPAANVELPWAHKVQQLHAGSSGAEPNDAFAKLDMDKDGFLSAEEISLANPMDRERVCNAETAVMCADKDFSGSISSEEFADTKRIQTCYSLNEPRCHGSGTSRDESVIWDKQHGVLVTWSKEREIYLLVNSSLTQKIRTDFRKADVDQSGLVNELEMVGLVPNNTQNPLCTGAVMLRCADEDASGSLDLIEYADMFNEEGITDDYKTCMSQNEALCNQTKTPSWNASGIPKVSYSPSLCYSLFAYRQTRDLCLRLQPDVCGKKCKDFSKNNTDECEAFQEMMCQVPKHSPQGEPLSNTSTVPKGKKASVATICIAVSNWGQNELWLARENKSTPIPLATRLAYMDCVQVHTFEGENLELYSGARQVTYWLSAGKNELIMVGRAEAGVTKAKLTRFSFKDEEMLRPILCHAAPSAKPLTVHVQGSHWHAFNNIEGVIDYLHCDVLLLDHDDSMRKQETLDLVSNDTLQLEIPVSPVQSLFLVKEEENGSLSYQAHNLGFLKY